MFKWFFLIVLIAAQSDEPSPTPTPEPTPTPTPSPTPTPVDPNITFPDAVFTQFAPSHFNPQPRSGAILVPSSDKHHILLLGGTAQNLWRFSFQNQSWTEVLQTLPYPINRACSAEFEGQVYIYGGQNHTALLEFDAAQTFTLLNEKSDFPIPSAGVACARRQEANGSFFVYGGDCTNELYVWEPKHHNWTHVVTKGDNPGPRTGASLLYSKETLILYGGHCPGDDDAVYRLDLTTYEWKKDPVSDVKPPFPHFHNAYIDKVSVNASMVIFGGQIATGLSNEVWSYDLEHSDGWKQLQPPHSPPVRFRAAATELRGRFFIFGGSDLVDLADFWQFVDESNCYGYSHDCETCGATTGCGWCDSNPTEYKCVSGHGVSAYVNSTCNSTFTTDILQCPEVDFPGWAVALIIAGIIIAVGTLWYVVMRTQSKEGYDRVVN